MYTFNGALPTTPQAARTASVSVTVSVGTNESAITVGPIFQPDVVL
jgi:hypothetical protein